MQMVIVSGLRQFMATQSPLKMMKKAFYFTVNLFSFEFLS